jgi:hypothetical protein
MTESSVRVHAEVAKGSTPYTLWVEPWGDEVEVTESSPAVVVFEGLGSGVPEIGILHGPDYVVVCANGGIKDYRVEDRAGRPPTGSK